MAGGLRITDLSVTTYIHSLDRGNAPFLEDMRSYAEDAGVPVIRREMESFIRVLIELVQPVKILEIGAGCGYSSLFMAEYTDTDCAITTIENHKERIEDAKRFIAASENGCKVTLLEGNAAVFLPELEGEYDFIFLDAAKGQYITFLPHILRLLRKGGALLADNVLQEGALVMSRYATPRRQRTIHDRMREFVWEVTHSPLLETSLIPIGDGVTLSIKK